MAVKATFVADFSSFNSGVEKAEVRLRTFESGIGRIDKDLSRFGNQFSGVKLIQEATLMEKAIREIGGTSKLTQDELQRAGNAAKLAIDKMRALGIDVPKGLRDVAEAAKPLSGVFGDLSSKAVAFGSAIGSFAGGVALQAVQALGSSFVSAAANGAKLSVLSGSFERLTESIGESSQAMLSMTRGATKGLVSDLDLIQSTNKAVLLGLPVTAKEMGELSKAAVTLGRAMGQDATKSLDDLITALGRSSPMILDNLGLTVKVGEANEKYAASLGKSAEALTDQEQKTAFYNAAMEAARKKTADLGDAQLTLTEQGSRLLTATGNLITKWASGVNEAGAFSDAIGGIAHTAEIAAIRMDAFAEAKRRMLAQPGAIEQQLTGNSVLENLGLFGGAENVNAAAQAEAFAVDDELNKVLLERSLGLATASRPNLLPKALGVLGLPDQQTLTDIDRKSKELFDKAGAAITKNASDFKKDVNDSILDLFKGNESVAAILEKGLTDEIGELRRLSVADVSEASGLSSLLDRLADISDNVDALGLSEQSNKPSFLIDFEKRQKGKGLGDLLEKTLGPTILQAVTGGGSVTQSIGSLVGGGVTDKLFGSGSAFGRSVGASLKNTFGDKIGGAIGAALPGIGTLLGPAISGIGKLFGKLFGGEGKKTNDLRDQAIAAAGGIDVLAKKAKEAGTSVDTILKPSKIKDFQAAWEQLTGTIDAFTNEQEADAQRLEAAIQRYGISFEQAGAAFQKQKLDEQAKELIEDWRVLVGSGIDLALVNEKMSGAINEYLQAALKVGQEIPSAFRPILQKMLEQGTLTDEAGVAITDLEEAGIHFSETMTQGFDRVVQKLDELIAKLVAAGTAMEQIGSPSIPANLPSFEPSSPDLPGFATGTGGRFLNFGSGTPVVLHGRERVSTAAEGQSEAGGIAAALAAMQQMQGEMIRLFQTGMIASRDQAIIAVARSR